MPPTNHRTGEQPDERRRTQILRTFLDGSGALRTMPARRAKRLVVLEHIAESFEPGERYAEREVNEVLRLFHPDVAALRRYLVDEGLLRRTPGVYWRGESRTHAST